MLWRRWSIGASLAAAVAAAAFVVLRDDAEPARATAPVVVASGGGGDDAPEAQPVRRYSTPTGIQTTVPDTIGYPERTAIYALEDGGFRVRVMEHVVEASSQEGVVVQQLPRAGVTRRLGWIVTIYVGRRR